MVSGLAGVFLHLATSSGLEAAPTPLTEVPVWPLPQKLSCTGERSGTLLSSTLKINLPQTSGDVVAQAAQRYETLLQAVGSASGSVTAVDVTLRNTAEDLTLDTDYSYSLSLQSSSPVLEVDAASPYGLGYALETLLQVQEKGCDEVELQDAPAFRHRGLMVDTGRRFYPISLLESVLEGMSMYKMNVLHFHVSEECFRIESKVYPSLHTANCTDSGGKSNNEFYTQEDVKHIVDFAKLRGIRVIPEFDMPGHSGGFCMGLQSEGIQCCGNQIADDSEGKSVKLINSVLDEMLELFPDDIVHIGCDETGSKEPCTLENTKSFEEKVIQHLLGKNKTIMGWEEILFKTGAAEISQDIIIDAWARSSWQQAAEAGHPVVDSENGKFYLDNLGGADHTAANMWLDITKGEANTTTRSLLLGGESSMWQDLYVGRKHSASCMFQSPERDDDFANSTSSMIWPRNAIAAGSFWRYNPQLSGTDDLFASVLARASSRLEARGVGSCHCTTPTKTGCHQENYCGHLWCKDGNLLV